MWSGEETRTLDVFLGKEVKSFVWDSPDGLFGLGRRSAVRTLVTSDPETGTRKAAKDAG
jgi:hypothetical protein